MYSCIEKSNLKLQEHQIKSVEWLMNNEHDSLLLVHPTGLGKTLTAVTASECFLEKDEKNKIIFVGPQGLLANFKKELIKFGVTDLSRYELYSYQKFHKLEYISECNNSLFIVDEVHNLRKFNKNNEKKSMSNSVYICSRYAEKVLLLTATPFVNSLEDFIPLINFLYGRLEIKSKTELIYPSDLEDYLKDKVYYMEIPENLKNKFPEVEETYINLYMDTQYEIDYCNAIKGDLTEGFAFSNPNAFYNAHRRAVNKIGDGDEYFSKKMYAILDLLGDSKSIIFSNWLEYGLKPIKNSLTKNKISNRIYSGELSMKEKEKIVKEFNENKYQVLVISKAGSEGLDLKEVRKVFIMDPMWNETGLQQVKGRAIRLNSHINLPKNERNVKIYYMVLMTKNILGCYSGDSLVYKFVEKKKLLNKKIKEVLKIISI